MFGDLQVLAERSQCPGDRLHHEGVLECVLPGFAQGAGRRLVGAGIGVAGRGPGQGMALDDVPAAPHEQLGTRAHQHPAGVVTAGRGEVHQEPVGVRAGVDERGAHRVWIDGLVGDEPDGAGQHDLSHPTGPDPADRGGHTCAVLIGGREFLVDVGGGPHAAEVGGRLQRAVGADDHLGLHEGCRSVGFEPESPHYQSAFAGA